jgi:hypothetical protein
MSHCTQHHFILASSYPLYNRHYPLYFKIYYNSKIFLLLCFKWSNIF